MSYKTNPILNRMKINKGWKNPYLPIKTLNYSRDISIWFKVYLLLKTFLNLKKIQLVSCEIRFDQQNKKLLYLRINKKGTREKKRKKKKNVLNKILKKFKTPMLKKKNYFSVFLLYKDLVVLKNSSFWSKNKIHKKILSNSWLAKPVVSTWLNTLQKIRWIKQVSTKKFIYSKKKVFIPKKHLKLKFYTIKQKQILTALARIKKKNLILFLKLAELATNKPPEISQKLIQNLRKRILINKIQIKKINAFYSFFLFSTRNVKKKRPNLKNIIFNRIQRQKLNSLWKILKKKFNSFGREHFLKPRLPLLLIHIKKNIFKPTFQQNWKFLKKNSLLKKLFHLNFLVAQIDKNNSLIRNYLLFSHWNFRDHIHNKTSQTRAKQNFSLNILQIKKLLKTKLYKNRKNNIMKRKLAFSLFYNISLWLLLRKKKKKRKKKNRTKARILKKKLRRLRRKIKFQSRLNILKKYNAVWKSKNIVKIKNKKLKKHLVKINNSIKQKEIAKYYKYRIPYRRSYFHFIKVTTNLKLKYLIQDFVQKYFSLQLEAKIVHVLNAHKNKNYFRLAFQVRKKKNIQLIKKKRFDIWNQKKIFLISQLKFATTFKRQTKQKVVKQNLKKNYIKILNKKEPLALSEKKKLKYRLNSYFDRIKWSRDFRHIYKYLIPTLIEFSRSLDPQLLANFLAKVLRKAKKQTWFINTIKYILQSIQLPRNIGYKIILTGRINSKKKSRLIYIMRKQITLQIFDNNMNFAYSQAKARIGTFGIKVWVYLRKNRKNEKNNSVTSKYQI